jgi:hypothetical protein
VLAPSPVGYVVLGQLPRNQCLPRGMCCGTSCPELQVAWVPIEGLAVLFVLIQFCVARPKEILSACQVMGGPLTRGKEEGCVSKVISIMFCGGGALLDRKRGRTTQRKTRLYDCTLGHPGEDVVFDS